MILSLTKFLVRRSFSLTSRIQKIKHSIGEIIVLFIHQASPEWFLSRGSDGGRSAGPGRAAAAPGAGRVPDWGPRPSRGPPHMVPGEFKAGQDRAR